MICYAQDTPFAGENEPSGASVCLFGSASWICGLAVSGEGAYGVIAGQVTEVDVLPGVLGLRFMGFRDYESASTSCSLG